MNKIQVFLCTAILVLGFMASANADSRTSHTATAKKKPVAPTPVPEPMTMALLGGGLVGLYGLKKKFDKD